jgi:hypothetical protein
MFAETYAEVTSRYPGAIETEAIVFVRGKIDRKRETPSLLINEVLPIAEALPRLTTTVLLKLDGGRHTIEQLRKIKPLVEGHKGNLPLFVQTETAEGQKVSLRLPKDMNVRPTTAMVEDLDRLLGSGTVQLVGNGTRRIKRLQQQALFKEAAQSSEVAAQPSDEQAAQQLDEEEMM